MLQNPQNIAGEGTRIPSPSSSNTSPSRLTEKLKARQFSNPLDPNSNKVALSEDDCADKLGFSFSSRRKWWIITVIFLVQTSMNFNASVYGNALALLETKFGVSQSLAAGGQAAFLIAYAFGCELWAPWSEERGRWLVLQLSLGFVNMWQIPAGLLAK
jgi:hypothetical protein